MEAMRQSWTDDRLDDFRGEVNRRFDEMDRRFEGVDKRFDRVDQRFDDLSRQMNARFDSFQRAMFQAAIALVTAILTVAAAIIATQL